MVGGRLAKKSFEIVGRTRPRFYLKASGAGLLRKCDALSEGFVPRCDGMRLGARGPMW